ncbi:MAG: hypothetical protein ACR2PT_03350 [Endozoicomonas sp.]
MNIFDESMNIMKSKVQLRKLFKDMHIEDVKRIISRIEIIHEEKLLTQMEAEEEQNRKRDALEAVLKEMQEKGLSIDDFQGMAKSDSERKGKPRQRFQFQYEKEDGTVVNWEGATTGRIPAEFSAYLKRTGKERKDCIVAEL